MRDCLRFLGNLLMDTLYHPCLLRPDLPYWGDFFRNSKLDSLLGEVELESANPYYAHIRFPDGRQSAVSTKDLGVRPKDGRVQYSKTPLVSEESTDRDAAGTTTGRNDPVANRPGDSGTTDNCVPDSLTPLVDKPQLLRRSTQVSNFPYRYGY